MTIRSLLYDAHGRDATVEVAPGTIEGLGDDQLLWIDIEGGEVSSALVETLGITAKIIARVTDLERKPYLDNYSDLFAFAVDAPDRTNADRTGNGSLSGVQLGFVVGKRYLLTIHRSPVKYISDFTAQDKGETAIGQLSPASLASALLDWHLTQFFEEVAEIETAVDEIDQEILGKVSRHDVLRDIVAVRARVSRLRTILAGQRPIFYGFARPDFALNFDEPTLAAFTGLRDRYERAIDEVERTRDVAVGSFELFTSVTTQQTNDLVKALTFLTAIVGLCAAVAGLLGMNFKLALFDTGLRGFLIVTGSLLAVALASLGFAKWRDWL